METYITVKKFSKITGLAEVTVRQWIGKGKIKSIKIGNARRIPESELKRILKGNLERE